LTKKLAWLEVEGFVADQRTLEQQIGLLRVGKGPLG